MHPTTNRRAGHVGGGAYEDPASLEQMNRKLVRTDSCTACRSLIAAVLSCLLLAMPRCAAIAQSLEDSLAIVRLIPPRAIPYAQRQAKEVRTLAVVIDSVPRGGFRTAIGSRLLQMVADSLLVVKENAPVCPWLGGQLAQLELSIAGLVVSNDDATATVFLSCAPSGIGRRAFGWAFTYTFRRTPLGWRLINVKEDWIT